MTTADAIGEGLEGKRTKNGWQAQCPAHEDAKASLSVGTGTDGKPLVHCHAGCAAADVIAALLTRGLWTAGNGNGNGTAKAKGAGKRIVAEYDYTDAAGRLLFQSVRFEPKDFSQRQPDGKGGWLWTLKGVELVPYRLPQLLAADPAEPVFVVEGEKDANALAALGLVATCNPLGGGKWRDEYNAALEGRHVVVIPDRDAPGRKHAADVARSVGAVAASVRVLELGPGKDAAEWVAAGGTAEALRELVAAAEPYNAAEHVEAEAEADTREKIEIHPWRRNAVIKRAAELLRDDIFLRDTMPVVAHTMTEAEDVHGVSHPVGGLVIAAATAQHAGHLLNQRLAPYKIDSRSKLGLPREYPKPWIEGMLGAATLLGVFRQLLGVVRAPLFDPATGAVTTAGGYDPSTRFYVDWHAGLPPIPDRPTEAEAKAALARLVMPWRGYADRVDAVAIASAALTAAVRPTLPTAPAIVCDGTVVGCGKGLFARTLSALATGGPPATMNEGASAEELEKRFAAAIISGAPVVLLDNVQRRLASSALESILTEGRADIRLFGTLTSINVACRALMLVTANNAAYRADLLRRALPVRIVAKSDTPEADTYDFDPVAEVLRDRAELLAAAFTVLRATVQKQPASPNLGSFEQWARLVGGACKWLLGTSPVELIAERKADDPDLAADHAIIEALAEAFPAGKRFTAAEASSTKRTVQRCSGDCDGTCRCKPTEVSIPWAESPGVEVDGDGKPKGVGYWLRARKDRFFGGRQLVAAKKDKSTNAILWQIEAAAVPNKPDVMVPAEPDSEVI